MKFATLSAALVLAVPVAVAPTEAVAQAKIKLGEQTLTISRAGLKPIQELQEAVQAKDSAAIPGKLAEAMAAAATADDRYFIAKLQLQAAYDSKDQAALQQAMESLLATGLAPADETVLLTLNLGKMQYSAKQFDKAGDSFERTLQLQPGNVDAMALLVESRHAQGRTADAVAVLQRATAASKAAGQKAPENWYKRMVALAFGAKLPNSLQLSREWVASYPTPENWGDSLRVYRSLNQLDDQTMLDLLRLARVTGALKSEGEYQLYSYIALTSANPAEAKAVIEEGAAAGAIDANSKVFRETLTEANQKSQGQKDRLEELARDAQAGGRASIAIRTGDIYYGYGEFAKAAELYRAALGKSGADKDLVNLRLGMALARTGDKAGATAAFNAVGGQRAELAKFWLVYLETQA